METRFISGNSRKRAVKFGYVEAAMECCDRWKVLPACDGKVQIVDVEVNDVEFARILSDDFEHSYVVCEGIDYVRTL